MLGDSPRQYPGREPLPAGPAPVSRTFKIIWAVWEGRVAHAGRIIWAGRVAHAGRIIWAGRVAHAGRIIWAGRVAHDSRVVRVTGRKPQRCSPGP